MRALDLIAPSLLVMLQAACNAPDNGLLDASAPGRPDGAPRQDAAERADASAQDGARADARGADAGLDGSAEDVGRRDAASGPVDGSTLDAGDGSDIGSRDAVSEDATPRDAVPVDAMPRDATPLDAVTPDAVTPDAEPRDATAPDAMDPRCRPTTPATSLYEGYCFAPDGGLDPSGICMEEVRPSGGF